MSQLQVPEELAARYETVRMLGHGGMGVAYLARDRELRRDVVVKIARDPTDPALRDRMLREARSLARLSHPNVVQVYGVHEVGDAVLLVLEYIEGEPLDRVRGDVDWGEIFVQAGEGLRALHGRGLVHRDIKPANILREAGGRVVLIDLGLVRGVDVASLTRTGAVVGTFGYLAPELFAGAEAGPGVDWFGLGVSLFSCLEGRLPFTADTVLLHARGRAELVPEFRRIRRADVRRVLGALLEPDPARRLAGDAAWTALRDLGALRDEVEVAKVASEDPTRSISGVEVRREGAGPSAGGWLIPAAIFSTLTGGALGWIPAAGRPPDRPPLARVTEPASAVAARWVHRLGELSTSHRVTLAHLRILGVDTLLEGRRRGDPYPLAMARVRLGPGASPGPSGNEVREARATEAAASVLPLHRELARDREALATFLGDPAAPLPRRRELHGALGKLEALDAYFLAWGVPAPYRVAGIRRAFVPVRVDPVAGGQRDELPTSEATGEGWTFRRESGVLPRPALFQDPIRPSLQQAELLRGWGMDPVEAELSREVGGSLPAGIAAQGVRVHLVVGNWVPPDGFEVALGDFRLVVWPEMDLSNARGYDPTGGPTHRIAIDVPPGIVPTTAGRVEVRLVTLPGLEPVLPADLWEVGVVPQRGETR